MRSNSGVKKIVFVTGVAAIFGLGVLTGNGTLHVTGGYTARTGLPAQLDYSSVDELYSEIRKNYNGNLDQDALLDGLKHGLANAVGDPYTEYFTPKEAEAFNSDLEGISLTGIGAQLDKNDAGGIVVIAPIEGSPAAAAGIRSRDLIVSIDSQPTQGMSVNEAVRKIRGNKGTKVTLGVQRGTEQLSFTIVRDVITVPTATAKMLDDGIGYIQISQFSSDTYDLVVKGARDLISKGANKFVVDLRDNPGGEVDSAQNISSLWLQNNDIVMQAKRGNKVVETYRATDSNILQRKPTAVLINGGSASAAEITALALRDHGAATLIGEKSYGKGVMQTIIPLSDGGQLKVTMSKWYSPKGTNIHKKGITPDQTVTLTPDQIAAGDDTQLTAAQNYLKSK